MIRWSGDPERMVVALRKPAKARHAVADPKIPKRGIKQCVKEKALRVDPTNHESLIQRANNDVKAKLKKYASKRYERRFMF